MEYSKHCVAEIGKCVASITVSYMIVAIGTGFVGGRWNGLQASGAGAGEAGLGGGQADCREEDELHYTRSVS